MICFASKKIGRLRNLDQFLGGDVLEHGSAASHANTFIGWGLKPSGMKARTLAAEKKGRFLLLEDGFLRSIGREDEPLSLVVDDLGAYYDARNPSRLEQMIAELLTPEESERARNLAIAWRAGRVSKYNQSRDYPGPLPERYVLVCDQTFGDASIQHGMATRQSFARMLEAAVAECPDCTLVVKTHPDVITRKKQGCFEVDALKKIARVQLIADDSHPARLLENAEAVYAVTSQMGFEALLWGKRVRCFGMPFYAGWGLTIDDLSPPPRRTKIDLEQLVHAALIRFPRYVHPETDEKCEAEAVLEYVAQQRLMHDRFPRDVYAAGFSRWKRPILGRFMSGSRLHRVKRGDHVPQDSTLALWGRKEISGLPETTRFIRIEDGFLRSVGLGADLTRPLSWVLDDEGIYYDSSRPSRLERILQETRFAEELLARASALRTEILDAEITKYNVSDKIWRRPQRAGKVILVPGQVEADASIRFGAPETRTNLDLLRLTREAHPDAYIVYKPHPDIVAGLRAKGKTEAGVTAFCDEIVAEAGMAQMLAQVDEVHTLTSLTGFEALLRGVPVTCHGQPFYSGWGLTIDLAPPSRRDRKLTVDQLVAGSLILYPTYVSRRTNRFTTPEQAVKELIEWRIVGGGGLPYWRKLLRSVFRLREMLSRA